MMAYLGQPQAPILFTVDTDTTVDAIRAYFNGCLSVLPLARMGAYGGYLVVKGLFNAGLIRYACQTEAWSYRNGTSRPPVWDERAQLRQWCVPGHGTFAGTIGGMGGIDGEEAVAEDFGQWRYGVPYAPQGDEDMTAQEHELLCRIRVATLSTSFDVAIIEAKQDGDAAKVATLQAQAAIDIANEKARLDPTHVWW